MAQNSSENQKNTWSATDAKDISNQQEIAQMVGTQQFF